MQTRENTQNRCIKYFCNIHTICNKQKNKNHHLSYITILVHMIYIYIIYLSTTLAIYATIYYFQHSFQHIGQFSSYSSLQSHRYGMKLIKRINNQQQKLPKQGHNISRENNHEPFRSKNKNGFGADIHCTEVSVTPYYFI